MLAQAMSKALSDCLPGIITAIQVQSQGLASNTSHAVSSSSLASILKLQATNSNTQPPLWVTSLFLVSFPLLHLFKPNFWHPISSISRVFQSTRIGGSVTSSFPAISGLAPLVGRDFVIGPTYYPIPNKLVSKIIGSQFVELADLLPDNLKINETETQTNLGW